MKIRFINRIITGIFCFVFLAGGVLAQQKDFGGTWKLDKANSSGLPDGMNQEMTVSHAGDVIKIETKVITDKGEQVISDTYNLDGKEVDFEPKFPGEAEAAGKRLGKWTGNGFEVIEKAVVDTPQGKVSLEMKRLWQISEDGKTIVIVIEAKSPQGEQIVKRTFIKM